MRKLQRMIREAAALALTMGLIDVSNSLVAAKDKLIAVQRKTTKKVSR